MLTSLGLLEDSTFSPANAPLLYFPPPAQPPIPASQPYTGHLTGPLNGRLMPHDPPPEPPEPPRLASFAPDTMLPDSPYSLLEDMRQAQSQHAGAKERIALYGFPAYLATNMRRVLARGQRQRADWCVAFSCLLWRGLLRYVSLPSYQSLTADLLALDVDDGIGTIAAEQVEAWRKGFRFSISDPTHTMGLEKCRAWKAPEYVHSELFDTAGKLGLAGSTLGTVCVMAALHDQEGVLGDHGEYMRTTVAELDGLLVERGRRLQGLVRGIRAGVWR